MASPPLSWLPPGARLKMLVFSLLILSATLLWRTVRENQPRVKPEEKDLMTSLTSFRLETMVGTHSRGLPTRGPLRAHGCCFSRVKISTAKTSMAGLPSSEQQDLVTKKLWKLFFYIPKLMCTSRPLKTLLTSNKAALPRMLRESGVISRLLR